MTEGSLVLYRQRPEWGVGVIEWIVGDRCAASFETPDGPYLDEFALGELEPAKTLETANG